jgi:hypothetical protein
MAGTIRASFGTLQPCEAPRVDVDEVVRAIGGLTFVGRLSGGEGAGAYEVLTSSGARAVLKFDDGPHLDFERAARVTSALRARGYPAPTTIATGSIGTTRYGVVELLSGSPGARLSAALLPRVVELVDMQRGIGQRGIDERRIGQRGIDQRGIDQRGIELSGGTPWLDDIATSVVDGRTGYCEHTMMARYSRETRALLDRLRGIAAAHANLDVPTDDIVHTDFHTDNMLVNKDVITGVIDWEGATSGDAAFDLVTQSLYAPEHRTALLDAARMRTDPAVLPLYAAHMALRQVDWSIRHHTDAEVRWYLDESAALLEAAGAG